MIWIEKVTCIHGIDEDGEYGCEQCADMVQFIELEKFLEGRDA
jgi:hypothetical protein